MYIGSDGKVYQNKFESLGHGTKMPGYFDEQREINDYLGQLRSRQQEYNGREQQQEQTRQQIDRTETDNFYNRQKQLAEVQGQPYGGYGPGNPNGAGQAGQQQRSGQGGFGMPLERKETVQSPLVQDAGKLNRLLQKYHQGQDPRDAEDAIGFINQHPAISVDNVSSLQMSHSDRNNDPLVSLFGDDGSPVKQFYLSSLANLNNFAGQKKQTYDPGRQVKEPEAQMEQLQAMAQQLAAQQLAGESESVRKKEMPAEIQHQFQQLMKQYGPRNPGYVDGPVQYSNQTPGFDVFGQQQQQDPLAALRQALGGGQGEAPPPPPGAPATATPKQGQDYGLGGNTMLPGDWRKYLPQNNPNYR